MESVIDTLHDQHQRMFRLLDILEREIVAFEKGKAFHAYVIDGILEYVETYPERFHRPIEQSLYRPLRERMAAAGAASVGEIEGEHGDLGAAVRVFRNAVEANARTWMFPSDVVVEKARDVIRGFRRHMTMEEERILPLAREMLSSDELEGIAVRNAAASADDGEERRFIALYQTIDREVGIGLGASGG